jgi:hypothetical protein
MILLTAFAAKENKFISRLNMFWICFYVIDYILEYKITQSNFAEDNIQWSKFISSIGAFVIRLIIVSFLCICLGKQIHYLLQPIVSATTSSTRLTHVTCVTTAKSSTVLTFWFVQILFALIASCSSNCFTSWVPLIRVLSDICSIMLYRCR